MAIDFTKNNTEAPKKIEINVDGFSHWMYQFVKLDVNGGEIQQIIDSCNYRMIMNGKKI